MATTPILGELVEAVVGDRADVSVLMDRTDDPRTFTLATASGSTGSTGSTGPTGGGDDDRLASADVIVAVDPATYEVGLAPAIDAARGAGSDDGPQVVIATEVLDARRVDGTADPHVWLDPDRFTSLAREVAQVVADRSGTDPGPWSAAAEAYGAQLALADEQVQATLAPLTPSSAPCCRDDESLGYFADRYGIEIQLLPPNVDATTLVIDVDRLGPLGSDTGTVAGLLDVHRHPDRDLALTNRAPGPGAVAATSTGTQERPSASCCRSAKSAGTSPAHEGELRRTNASDPSAHRTMVSFDGCSGGPAW